MRPMRRALMVRLSSWLFLKMRIYYLTLVRTHQFPLCLVHFDAENEQALYARCHDSKETLRSGALLY